VKYCNEHLCVCVCVCLSVCRSLYLFVCEHVSPTTCTIFTNFLCMLHMAVARSSERVTKSQGEGPILWVYSIDIAFYSIAYKNG